MLLWRESAQKNNTLCVKASADCPVLSRAISASLYTRALHKSGPAEVSFLGVDDLGKPVSTIPPARSAAIQLGTNLIFTSLNCSAEVAQREKGKSPDQLQECSRFWKTYIFKEYPLTYPDSQ